MCFAHTKAFDLFFETHKRGTIVVKIFENFIADPFSSTIADTLRALTNILE